MEYSVHNDKVKEDTASAQLSHSFIIMYVLLKQYVSISEPSAGESMMNEMDNVLAHLDLTA